MIKDKLNYDPDTGKLIWKITLPNGVQAGTEAGCLTEEGYVRLSFKNKQYLAHRLAFEFMNEPIEDGMVVDHINGIPDDNRWCNLRLVTPQQNKQNYKLETKNNTGVKNVRKSGNKYQVRVAQINYGVYEDLELAELVAGMAREKHFGEYARK